MYAVSVFFGDDSDNEDTVEAHPSSWLSPGRTRCLWPPINPVRAINKNFEPRETWTTHKIKEILTFSDDLKVAREKATKATLMSDISTDTSDVEKAKSRQRRQKRVDFDSSDGDDEHCPAPPPSKTARTKADVIMAQSDQLLLSPPTPPAGMTSLLSSMELPQTPRSVQPLLALKSVALQSCQQAKNTLPKANTERGISVASDLNYISKRDKVFLQHLVEIKAETRMNRQVLQSLKQQVQSLEKKVLELHSLSSSGCAGSVIVSKPPAGVVLPLETIKHVEQLERQLRSSPADVRNLVTYLGRVGGFAVKDTTRRVMSELMTNALAMQFNFLGHGGKHAFSKLILKDIVNDSVRRNHATTAAANAEIEQVIREWLRLASDRNGGRRNRDEKGKKRHAAVFLNHSSEINLDGNDEELE